MEAAITERTKAIIPVDLGGVPCDYARIFEIVERKRNLFQPSNEFSGQSAGSPSARMLAHAPGATWNGQIIGGIADFSSFSFHAVKNFTTAEGGALTWRTIPGISSDMG